MATLSSGDTLSLNALKSATGAAAASLSGAKGNTTGPIAMSSFAIDSVGSISGYTYGVENTNENYTLSFGGAGSNFDSRIASRAANFTWSRISGTTINASLSNSGKTATVSFLDNGANASQTTRNTVAANGIRVVFSDGYNDHIGAGAGYGANKDKTIYCVDSYDGNNQALCLTADSPITKADGTIVNIEDLQEGDTLKGFSINGLSEDSDADFYSFSSDSLGGSSKDVTVVNVVFSFAERYYSINGGEITATSEHPLFIKDLTDGLYKFKPVIGLEIGDKLIKGVDGTLTEVDITSIDAVDGTIEVVSIDVEAEDTYMVNGYVTHNKGGNSFTDFDGPTAPTSVSYSHPNLSWSGGTADADSTAGITAYDIQVDNNSDFSSPAIDVSNWNDTSMQLAGGTALSAGTYYARVRNVQSGLKSGWTTSSSFSVVV